MLNLFIVPSVINTCDKPLSYHPIRSAISHEQRYQQTLQQLDTIRDKVPNSYIVLVEASSISDDMENTLKAKVDHYMNVSNIPEVAEATNGLAKGHGEVIQLLSYLHSNHFKSIRDQCITVSKFGGRIKFTDRYIFSVPDMPRIILEMPQCMRTILYTMPNQDIDGYIAALEECLTVPALIEGNLSIEYCLYGTWFGKGKPFTEINVLGVEGYCAPFASYYNI